MIDSRDWDESIDDWPNDDWPNDGCSNDGWPIQGEPAGRIEAMVQAAGDYVRASDDLRPRVLETIFCASTRMSPLRSCSPECEIAVRMISHKSSPSRTMGMPDNATR